MRCTFLHMVAHFCRVSPAISITIGKIRESFAKSGKKLSLHHGNKAQCSISVENHIRIHSKNPACFLTMAKWRPEASRKHSSLLCDPSLVQFGLRIARSLNRIAFRKHSDAFLNRFAENQKSGHIYNKRHNLGQLQLTFI